MTEAAVSNDEFTAFWNNVLVAKFERSLRFVGDHGAQTGRVDRPDTASA
jgi:hypothetical protein